MSETIMTREGTIPASHLRDLEGRMRNGKWVFGVLLVMVFGWASFGFAGEAAKVTIKVATLAPKEASARFEKVLKEIKKRTQGQLRFKVYYGGVQGDESDVIRKIRLGQLHGAGLTGHGLGQIVPEVRVTELPYLFWNYGEVDYVRAHLEADMNRRFEVKGFEVLGWAEVGFVYTFSKVPITSVEIARQQKWWLWEGDPLAEAIFEAMGISPVPLSLTDVLTSLSTRLIDTAGTTPFGAVAFHWNTRFKYMNEYPVVNSIGALVVTRKAWEKVSPENRKIAKALLKDYYVEAIQHEREANARSIEALKKGGIQIVHSDPESETSKFVLKACKTAREALVGKLYSRELLDRTLSLLQEYRDAHPDSTIVRIE